MKDNDIIFALRVDDIQQEANNYLGRKLNKEELEKFSNLLSDGMGETISPIYAAIFDVIKNG